ACCAVGAPRPGQRALGVSARRRFARARRSAQHGGRDRRSAAHPAKPRDCGGGVVVSIAIGAEAIGRRSAAEVAKDYVALTKPRVIVLLEVTTLAAMMMPARGWRCWNLVIATLGGGWLAASGANAINCWFDRDIDARMW